MKRVYVAGAYSADNVIDVLENIRRGMQKGTEVLLAGYAPFVPWFDFHFQLMLKETQTLTVQDYYNYSIAWLKASDYILVLPNSENSKGTQTEIRIAKELGIPVVTKIESIDLIEKSRANEGRDNRIGTPEPSQGRRSS